VRSILSRRRFGQTAFAAFASACARQDGNEAHFVVHGGAIYTGLVSRPTVQAVRVQNGRIAAFGSLEDARAGAGGARLIDLGGGAAFPGFTDAHVHLTGVGLQAMMLDLVGVGAIAELQQRLRDYAATHREGAIVGRGWIETHWPERRFPTRADLDAVVGDRPVVLERIDGHASVANSAALAAAHIDANTRDPDGGRIERDASGAPTGMLIDNAANLVQGSLPQPTPAMLRQALAQAAQLYASRGWVGVNNMSTSAREVAIYQELAQGGELPLHADIYLTPEDSGSVLERGPYADPTGLVRVRGVKLYMDGALGSRGAALLAPYNDAPSSGLLVTPIEEMREIMRRAREKGAQVATHAIGDRGNRLVLDAYRDTFVDNPASLRGARWRIEHAQVLSAPDLPRFAQMGVIASMQPSHAISDLHFAPARLGPARLSGAYAWKPLLDSGAVIAAGSDAPVEKGDPLIEFYAASYRHDLTGFAGPDWHLENAVSREQAMRMLSWAPAFAAFAEVERGVLDVGKRADLSAFSVDLMAAAPGDIPTAQPVLTISGGRITHERA
jgi:predicted amidohydrolase YtcJ